MEKTKKQFEIYKVNSRQAGLLQYNLAAIGAGVPLPFRRWLSLSTEWHPMSDVFLITR